MKVFAAALMLFLSATSARALCVGGVDGPNKQATICSELGSLGDLRYERENGAIKRKRTDKEIREFVKGFVDDHFKNHGVRADNVKVGDKTVTFDAVSVNGDKLYSFALDKETGTPANERLVTENRPVVEKKRADLRKSRLNELDRIRKFKAATEAWEK